MKKRLSAIFLAFVMAVTMLPTAFANEATIYTSALKDYESLEAALEDPNFDLDYALNEYTESPILQEFYDYTVDENGDILYNYVDKAKTTLTYSPSNEAESQDSLASDEKTVFTEVNYGYNSSAKKIKFIISLHCPLELDKPDVDLKITIKSATTKDGTYRTVTAKKVESASYIKNYVVEVSGTAHYKVVVDIDPNDASGVINDVNTFYHCINRTGKLWEYYHEDEHSGVTIEEPPTNWKEDARYSRPSNLNQTYKKNYDNKYGTDIKIGALYQVEVHHVRPLQFGGNNGMSNLVHIPKSLHSKITGWFRAYV